MADIQQLNVKSLLKMLFVYNAVIAGWSVKMIEPDTFEFQIQTQQKPESMFNDYLKTFVRHNFSLEQLHKSQMRY
jgi:hypothetical protein